MLTHHDMTRSRATRFRALSTSVHVPFGRHANLCSRSISRSRSQLGRTFAFLVFCRVTKLCLGLGFCFWHTPIVSDSTSVWSISNSLATSYFTQSSR